MADSPELSAVKSQASKEISIVAKVLFAETPPRLVLESAPEKSGVEGTEGKGGMEGMKGMNGM